MKETSGIHHPYKPCEAAGKAANHCSNCEKSLTSVTKYPDSGADGCDKGDIDPYKGDNQS